MMLRLTANAGRGCRARQAWNAGGHAKQDAHVNTSAARFWRAPAGWGRTGGLPCCPRFAPVLPPVFCPPSPVLVLASGDARSVLVRTANRAPFRASWATMDDRRTSKRYGHDGQVGRASQGAQQRADCTICHPAGRDLRSPVCATRPLHPRKCRLPPRTLPMTTVHAAAPCQNSRSSSRLHGAPFFRFVRSQGLPCRHCSGLV